MLDRLLDGRSLREAEAADLLLALVDESMDPALAGALLAALRAHGETPDELRGMALAMRSRMRRPRLSRTAPLVDTCGTGGDGTSSVNLSTGSALLVAACGVRVAKHGNRAVSSRCGSADVVEALGLPLPLDESRAGLALDRLGFTFLFAPHFHPAMRRLAQVRRALGVRTAFNLLGPLVNPAEPEFQSIGAFDRIAARRIADALSGMSITRAFVVHGACGFDEPTPCGPFDLLDVRPGSVVETRRDPREFGVARCDPDDLAGGNATENARALRDALSGAQGPCRDAVVLGAALVLELVGHSSTPIEAARTACAAIDDGRAARLLADLAAFGRTAEGDTP